MNDSNQVQNRRNTAQGLNVNLHKYLALKIMPGKKNSYILSHAESIPLHAHKDVTLPHNFQLYLPL